MRKMPKMPKTAPAHTGLMRQHQVLSRQHMALSRQIKALGAQIKAALKAKGK